MELDTSPSGETASGAVDDEPFLVIPGALDVSKNEPPCLDRFSRPGSRPDIQRQIEGELRSEGLRGQGLQFSFVI